MRKTVIAAALGASFVVGAAVSAQVVPRVFDNGSVWTVTYVDVKPGHGNAYMKWLKDVQRPRIEHRKKEGDILSYRVLSVMAPRDTDPDVVILTEFRNMAVFDRAPSYFEELDRRFAGSLEGRQKQLADVREMTDPRGSLMARELRWTQ